MESCSRIALGILLLTAYLLTAQTNPVTRRENSGLSLLLGLQCDKMTFTSPTDVQSECCMQALKHYVDGLKNATSCQGINPLGAFRIDDIVRVLNSKSTSICKETGTNSYNCNFTMTAHQSFKDFVKATMTFIEMCNN